MTKYNDIIEYIDSTYDIEFEKVKVWAKENNADIVELVDRRKTKSGKLYRYFQIIERQVKQPTEEEKAVLKRLARDEYINNIEWRVNRYQNQKILGIDTDDSKETYMNILRYIQYLREIPQQKSFPDIDILSFEDWQKTIDF